MKKKKVHKKLFPLISLMVVLCTLLGACGAATSAPDLVSTQEVVATDLLPAPTQEEAADTAEPTTSASTGPAGELVAVRADEPATLDWKDINSEPQNWTCGGIVEALTDKDPRIQQVVPVLAESWEWDGDKTWTFKLRQGVKFHNGEPFNAEAVIYSFERIADPDENAQLASHLNNMESIQALDDFTIEIKTIEVDPIFAGRLSVLSIGPPEYTEQNPDLLSTTLIGTGPYKFVEWEKGQYFKLTANQEYWGEVPKIQDVTILFRAEPTVRAAMVSTGEASLAWAINPEDIAGVPKVVQYADLSTILMRVDTTGQNPALADPRVRQAMLYAVDSATAAETIFKDVAIQVKGNQQVPPVAIGYDDTLEPWPYDPEKAKELIAEARDDGVPVDTPIVVYERGKGWFAHDNEFAEYAVNAWNEIGLNAQLEIVDAAAWVDLLFAIKPEDKHADLLYMLHSLELMDYSHSAQRFLYSDARYSLWNDAKTDELLDAAASLEGKERNEAYQKVARYLEDQVPLLVFGSTVQTHATSENLQWEPRSDGEANFWEMSFAE